jgi:hypothetical protein
MGRSTNRRFRLLLLAVPVAMMGVLAASSQIAAAKPPWKPGHQYCMCNCYTSNGAWDIIWEKTYHCRANGRRCRDPRGKLGELIDCYECTAEDSTTLGSCIKQRRVGSTQGEPQVAPPPPRKPRGPSQTPGQPAPTN